MTKRPHRETSSAGEAYIKPFKPSHKQKIVEALGQMPVGATHEEISDKCGLRPDQVWKRLSECMKDGTVYDTGLTRKLKSGVPGIIWKVTETQKWLTDYLEGKHDPNPIAVQTNLF